jgi:hypothetical protein
MMPSCTSMVSGQRGGHQESSGFDADEHVRRMGPNGGGELVDTGAPRRRMGQQRRDVVEQYARFGEIRHGADMRFQVHGFSLSSIRHSAGP